MKKMFLVFFVVLVLSACVAVPNAAPKGAMAQGLVAMPDELRLLILSLVTAAVTWLLLQAGIALKIDMSGYVTPIVAIVTPILVTLVENVLGTIPSAWDNIVLAVIHVVVLLIGSLGSTLLFKRTQERALKHLLA